MNKLTAHAIANNKGEIGYYGLAEIEDFGKRNKGKKMLVKFTILDEDLRKRLLAVYFASTIEIWQHELWQQQGEIKNKKQIDEYLRGLCPITQEQELKDLDLDQLCMFLDFLKDYTLININTVIEDWRGL